MLTANSSSSINYLTVLAKIVSNAGLNRMMFADNFNEQAKQLKQVLKKNGIDLRGKYSVSALINTSYQHLLSNYRHEYLYKVALLNTYVLSNYSLSDTILLNEFRIGNSKADAILINGVNKVFEIKTELDSPERLQTQINDYFKAFSEVYIIIHHSQVGKYINLVDKHVGIMLFSEDNKIEPYKSAEPFHEKLDTIAMIKALRKNEYIQLVYEITGTLPVSSPIKLFKTCVDLLRNQDALTIQAAFLKIIKQRIEPNTNELLRNSILPDPMRLSCYYHNLNKNDYLNLVERLTCKI